MLFLSLMIQALMGGKPSSTLIYDDILASRLQIKKDLKGKAGHHQLVIEEDPS